MEFTPTSFFDVAIPAYLSFYLIKVVLVFREVGFMYRYIASGEAKNRPKDLPFLQVYALSFMLVVAMVGLVYNLIMVIPLLFTERMRFFANADKGAMREFVDKMG